MLSFVSPSLVMFSYQYIIYNNLISYILCSYVFPTQLKVIIADN